ncbi:GGDEF domain-containing protein [Aliivibrio sp. S4TY2]|uniref:GGDEF domain-containing protein n=1 Tax=unclassified Aliivibrio TaxID=2645654 RepID=UPI0023786B53|nr:MULTISPECIES: GGDEF domain-containing protein [unclassified Aliivibrio]MDD9156750.1 GGDEF domain-containing protein [Aliivibrio sp. S4TY2]MDD9160236.1 GGDEF domain-containing protein [Aliivibrio sp. S4TY1]MDD9164471.1 GGDEF domain-containing protein [Aliivibrio sp. S4MY2]MDD9168659.1 GGDEF domain-containing protein [Aliivibrio sp. S4MY4]MDD9184806.1 GGDEF domain-containing protein [Aliivibrio sp. S4MY3]
MKKVILFITGIIIISNAIVFIVNDLSHNHGGDVDVTDYEQQLLSLTQNCEPLECRIIDDFNRINKNEYSENIKAIGESIRPILAYKNGPKIGIAILNIVFENGSFSCDDTLYFLDKIATLKSKDNDLFGMIDPMLSYIQIANESEDKFKIASGELSIASAISYFKGYEFSNKIIQSIIYSEDTIGWRRLKNQAMVTLAENELALDNPIKALKALSMVDKNGTEYSEEDWRDYYIYTLALKSEAYTYLGQLDQASKYLSVAKDELEKDQMRFLLGKTTLVSVVEFQLSFRKKDFSYIEEKKEELLSIVDLDNQARYAKVVYNTLFDYYYQIGDISKLYDINHRYYLLINKKQNNNYQLLISNKLKQSENAHLSDDHEKSMFFLKISFSVLMLISILLFFTIVRIKYLNIENFTDPLTNCLNRRKFNIDYGKLAQVDHTFLILDIDNFKAINDNYGHDFGDGVLVKVASTITRILGSKHKCYRIGGEEFVVIFDTISKSRSIHITESIRKATKELVWDNGIFVTISGGLSSYSPGKNTYKVADELLYKAKRGTKNTIFNDIESS